MNIALARGGLEVIAEGFFASMRCHQQPGHRTVHAKVFHK